MNPSPSDEVSSTPFDRALEMRALREAAEAYAAKRGEPGSPSYRAAWLKFRQRFQSMEELRQWRSCVARRAAQDRTPTAPARSRERARARRPLAAGQAFANPDA